jgi:hypothetical protein
VDGRGEPNAGAGDDDAAIERMPTHLLRRAAVELIGVAGRHAARVVSHRRLDGRLLQAPLCCVTQDVVGLAGEDHLIDTDAHDVVVQAGVIRASREDLLGHGAGRIPRFGAHVDSRTCLVGRWWSFARAATDTETVSIAGATPASK